MVDIRGRVALVTGGGSGIGRALARALAAEGASVAVADIIYDNARSVADGINEAGARRATAIACDVSDRASVRRAAEEVSAVLGRVSLLFANAGATSFEDLTDMSDEDVDWMFQVNLMGVVNCLREFLPDMIAARDGHAFATASEAGLLPAWVPGHAAYSAAKMGVIGMMLNLRLELADSGVGASVLCPGGVATGMKENNGRYRPERFGGPSDRGVEVPAKVAETFAAADLTFRPPEDVAAMVLAAVRANRPMVLTDGRERATFQKTYVDLVMSAFDEAAEFDRSTVPGR